MGLPTNHRMDTGHLYLPPRKEGLPLAPEKLQSRGLRASQNQAGPCLISSHTQKWDYLDVFPDQHYVSLVSPLPNPTSDKDFHTHTPFP